MGVSGVLSDSAVSERTNSDKSFAARVVGLTIFATVLAVPARADVIIFAAASLATALNEITAIFAAKGTGKAKVSLASSSILAKQIANGAPADIYISANADWMNYLVRKKAILAASRVDLVANRLVLIVPTSSTFKVRIVPGFPLARALGNDRLAMGDPDHVPAGMYAKAALINLGVWKSVASRIAPTLDVRAALVLVQRGEAGAGIVYATDALITDRVRVVDAFPGDSHPPITYPAAIVAGQARPEVWRFFSFLTAPEATTAFSRQGFQVIRTPSR